jgi:hypothetical protein
MGLVSKRKRQMTRYMNTWQIKPLIIMMAILALMLSGCGIKRGGVAIPEPILDYGWSQERMEIVNGQKTAVQCMTLNDIRKIDIYIELLKANEEVSR